MVKLYTWGQNTKGQIGDGTLIDRHVPTPINHPSNGIWSIVYGGGSHTVALDTSGNLYTWGYNNYGQLGDDSTIDKDEPTLIEHPEEKAWVSTSIGAYHTVATDINGNLYTWGSNAYGQLGDATLIDKDEPTLIEHPEEKTWQSVSAGDSHTLAIDIDGNLYTWGSNAYGQLGDGTTENKSTPTLIVNPTEAEWVYASGGEYHSFAIDSDSNLYTWGGNSFGQLGDNSITQRDIPTLITHPTSGTWSAVSGGGSHSIAMDTDSNLYTWGFNFYGQIGDGTTSTRKVPTLIDHPASGTWKTISRGSRHTLVIDTAGSLYAWGDNYAGQLGDGSTTQQNGPTLIEEVTGGIWVKASGVGMHTVGIFYEFKAYAEQTTGQDLSSTRLVNSLSISADNPETTTISALVKFGSDPWSYFNPDTWAWVTAGSNLSLDATWEHAHTIEEVQSLFADRKPEDMPGTTVYLAFLLTAEESTVLPTVSEITWNVYRESTGDTLTGTETFDVADPAYLYADAIDLSEIIKFEEFNITGTASENTTLRCLVKFDDGNWMYWAGTNFEESASELTDLGAFLHSNTIAEMSEALKLENLPGGTNIFTVGFLLATEDTAVSPHVDSLEYHTFAVGGSSYLQLPGQTGVVLSEDLTVSDIINFTSCEISASTPENTQMKVSISFDSGSSWKVPYLGNWIAVSGPQQGLISEEFSLGIPGMIPETSTTQLGVWMETSTEGSSPGISSIILGKRVNG